MNPKTKKIVIIGSAVLAVGGLLAFLLLRKKTWISFNFYSGQENGNATGVALTNTSQLPKNLGAGSKIEIKMDSGSEQTLNGRIVTVKYLGYDTNQGDSSLGYITFNFPTPPNPNKLPKSGSFRVV